MSSQITLLDRLLRLPDIRRADAWVAQHGPIGPRRADAWRLWQVAVRAPGAAALEWMDQRTIEAGFELQADEAHLLLHLAMEHSQLVAADWLYARGAPLENPREGACLEVEMEPIHIAAMAGQAASVKWLAQHGALIEPEQDFPMPPLRLAVSSANIHALPVVKALLESGAKAARIGPDGNPGNVLENLMDGIYAFESRGRTGVETFRQLWTLLTQAGADPAIPGRYGRSALDRIEMSPQGEWQTTHARLQAEEQARQILSGADGDASTVRSLPRQSATSPALLRMRRRRR